MTAKWKLVHVRNRLGDLLNREGGISREEAVTRAEAMVEDIRESSECELRNQIAGLEALLPRTTANVTEDLMAEVLRQADCILTLSGTFGFAALDIVTKSLCDLVEGMLRQGIFAADPIRVHLRAMRLFAPGAPSLSSEEAESVTSELGRILTHLGCRPAQPAEPGKAAAC